MNAGDGEQADSFGRPEEGPLEVDRSGNEREDKGEPEVVLQSNGQSVNVPHCMPCPKTPRPELVARHNLTHLPYANWCPHCVAARRANNPHFQRAETFRRHKPLFVLDYAFIRNSQDEDLMTMLVGKLYPFNKFFACIVDAKGKYLYAIDSLSKFIKDSGLTDFVYKCDQERS